jgi:hypothetical protein
MNIAWFSPKAHLINFILIMYAHYVYVENQHVIVLQENENPKYPT